MIARSVGPAFVSPKLLPRVQTTPLAPMVKPAQVASVSQPSCQPARAQLTALRAISVSQAHASLILSLNVRPILTAGLARLAQAECALEISFPLVQPTLTVLALRCAAWVSVFLAISPLALPTSLVPTARFVPPECALRMRSRPVSLLRTAQPDNRALAASASPISSTPADKATLAPLDKLVRLGSVSLTLRVVAPAIPTVQLMKCADLEPVSPEFSTLATIVLRAQLLKLARRVSALPLSSPLVSLLWIALVARIASLKSVSPPPSSLVELAILVLAMPLAPAASASPTV